MKYEFNQETSYMLFDKEFINIGLLHTKFKTEDDLSFYIADVLLHEHIHHAILNITDTNTCVRFDFIAKDIRKFVSPHISDIQKRNGFHERTREDIQIYYEKMGMLDKCQ